MRVIKIGLLSLLFIFVLALIAVAFAPARLLLIATDRWAPQVEMSEPTGTLWQGEAKQVAVTINGIKLELGTLSWHLSALSLLTIEPSIELVVKAPEHQAQMRVSANTDQEITVDNMEGTFPLSLLEPWVPLLIEGDLAFVVDHIIFNQRQLLAVDGVLNLQEADWVGGDIRMPLGSYIAQVSLAENRDVLVQLNDFSATLGIDGLITISPAGHYHFNCVLQKRDGLAPEVAQSVSWFGKKNAQGDILVDQKGRWN